jgi:hypothetical protein
MVYALEVVVGHVSEAEAVELHILPDIEISIVGNLVQSSGPVLR